MTPFIGYEDMSGVFICGPFIDLPGNCRHMFLGLDTHSMLHMPPRYNGIPDGTLRISLAHSHLHFRLFAAIYIRLLFRTLYLLFALRDNTYIHSTLSCLLSAPSLLCFAIHIHNSSDRSTIPIPILSIRLPLFYPHNGLYVIPHSIRISTICTGLSLVHVTLSFGILYPGVLYTFPYLTLCFIIFLLYLFWFYLYYYLSTDFSTIPLNGILYNTSQRNSQRNS